MSHPIPLFHAKAPLDETLVPTSDNTITQWEDEGGATTNLYQSVNANNDATHVELRNANVMVSGTTNPRTLRFNMGDPSDVPNVDQSVQVIVRAEWIDAFGSANPTYIRMDSIALRQGTTQKAISGANNLTTSPADYVLQLSGGEIGSITDWTDLNVEMLFDADGIDIGEEIDVQVYRVRIVLAP